MPRYFGPYPYAPFAGPVDPPPLENMGDFCITLDKKWIPYMVALLYTLTADQTWASDKERAIGEAENIILAVEEQLECFTAMDTSGGIEVNEDCEMKLRYCSGKLQVCDCGTWVDVPSCDGDTGTPTPSQPGAGSPLPSAGGGSERYCGALAGKQKWFLPTTVSTGDVILFSDLNGAWNDGTELTWHCPDGWWFFGGTGSLLPPLVGLPTIPVLCAQPIGPYTGSSVDPLSTGLHMAIVASIDGTFYDPIKLDSLGAPQPFTVPAGITNGHVVLQANYDYSGNLYGEVTFCVNVTNNQTPEWVSIFDFQRSNYQQLMTSFFADWTSGIGLQGKPTGGSAGVGVYFQLLQPGVQVSSMSATFNASAQIGGSAAEAFYDAHGFYIANQPGQVGTNLLLLTRHAQTLDAPGMQVFTGDPSGTAEILSLVINGTGTKPPTWP